MSEYIILIDIGNSYTEYAQISSKTVPTHFEKIRFPTSQLLENLPNLSPTHKWIVASVVPDLDPILLNYNPNTVFVSHTLMSTQMEVDVIHPHQVGADRLICAYAAREKYGAPALIIDSGTAMTFCLVSPEGRYQGGSILPGLGISSRALNDYTAKIPLIQVAQKPTFIGRSTEECVQSGLYWGFSFMINGFIEKYKTLYPTLSVIGTGNGMETLSSEIKLDSVDPDLIFYGLARLAHLSSLRAGPYNL